MPYPTDFQTTAYDQPQFYLYLPPDEACLGCREGRWACSIGTLKNTGGKRPTATLVSVSCNMCTNGRCSFTKTIKSVPTPEKWERLERWKREQDGIRKARKEWFESGNCPYTVHLTNALKTMCLSTSADTIAGGHHSMNKRKGSSPIHNLRAPTNFAAQANLAIVKTYSSYTADDIRTNQDLPFYYEHGRASSASNYCLLLKAFVSVPSLERGCRGLPPCVARQSRLLTRVLELNQSDLVILAQISHRNKDYDDYGREGGEIIRLPQYIYE